MGILTHSIDHRVSRLEAFIPGMIQAALATRIVVTTLTATIAALRKDMDQLKSIDMSMIFGMIEIPNMLVEPGMPLNTTKDDVRVEEVADPESEAEMDKEMFGVAEKASYEGGY
ncbi:hypothetical protein H5410_005065 [Solanum commersonii]|uniref:Polyprotein protein n=1 Tax=Solanum commersonii TaxID=4109 RepID=A0A9J6A728_SOLCO|nr:hypothetical protein H5410_005065 [Solanum commersonii]